MAVGVRRAILVLLTIGLIAPLLPGAAPQTTLEIRLETDIHVGSTDAVIECSAEHAPESLEGKKCHAMRLVFTMDPITGKVLAINGVSVVEVVELPTTSSTSSDKNYVENADGSYAYVAPSTGAFVYRSPEEDSGDGSGKKSRIVSCGYASPVPPGQDTYCYASWSGENYDAGISWCGSSCSSSHQTSGTLKNYLSCSCWGIWATFHGGERGCYERWPAGASMPQDSSAQGRLHGGDTSCGAPSPKGIWGISVAYYS